MIVMLILAFSILLQFFAAIIAFRLIPLTGRRTAWSLIAAALMLMALRRCIPLIRMLSGDTMIRLDFNAELTALVISLLMVVGISRIAPIFTERKRAEEALQKSELKYRMLHETMTDAFVLMDMSGRILECNRTYREMLGYTEDELLNLTYLDITPEKWHAIEARIVQEEILLHNFSGVYEKEYRNKDGTIFPVELRVSLLRDDTGQPKAMHAIIRDITERKRAEEALRESEERYQLANRATFNTIWDWNLQTDALWWNENFQLMFGYQPKEIEPGIESWTNRIHPEDLSRIKSGIYTAINSGQQSWTGEYRFRRKDGSYATVVDRGFINRDANGKALRMIGAMEDMTERKLFEQLQNALYQISEETNKTSSLNDLYRFVHEVISTIMPAKNFYISLYDEINNLINFPYSIDEVDTLRPPRLFGNGLTEFVFRKGKALLVNSEQILEMSNKGEIIRSGSPSAVWLGVPLIVGTKAIGVMVVQHYSDSKVYGEKELQMLEYVSSQVARVIERKRVEQELIISKEKAEQSDKLKTEFLAQMSHEIRSPMNAIISFANILREELDEKITPDLKEYFDGIDSAGHRLIRTVDMILNSSELQIGTYEPIFTEIALLGEIITRIENDFNIPLTEKGLKYNFISNINEAIVHGDKYTIYQLFVNLVDNAIKYTKQGSILMKVEKNEQLIKVSIEDTGIGMSEEFMTKMYLPFTQEERGYSRSYEGSGLGLSLVKKYCDLNGITIEAESKKGIGTKFTLIFTEKK